MNSAQVLILDHTQITQKITRIAWQILEDNLDEKEVVLAGIWEGGYKIALRLKSKLEEIAPFEVTLVKIILAKNLSSVENMDEFVSGAFNKKVVILIDDVLNSGRTMACGLGVFLNSGYKKIRTTVLIDRSHRIFPVAADFVGLQLATMLKEHVHVVLDAEGTTDCVYLK